MMLISDAPQRLCIPLFISCPSNICLLFEPVHSVANLPYHIGWQIQRNLFLAKTGLLERK